ncbi:MAG: hypothetical protein WCW26_00210 [Candidatus Buchananbacteria bacterium]
MDLQSAIKAAEDLVRRAAEKQRLGFAVSDLASFSAIFQVAKAGQGSITLINLDAEVEGQPGLKIQVIDWQRPDGEVFRFHYWTYDNLAVELAKVGIELPAAD